MNPALVEDYLAELIAARPAPAAPTPVPVPMPAPVPMPVREAEPPPAPPPRTAAADVPGEEAPAPRRRAHERTSTWLRLLVNGQPFAVEVLKVQEVLRVPEIVPVRGAPAYVLGLMNMRGQLVAVLDLACRLALPPRRSHARPEEARIVVLEENGSCLGLRVDAVADVVALADSVIEKIDGPLLSGDGELLRGVARVDEVATVLLDAHALLDD